MPKVYYPNCVLLMILVDEVLRVYAAAFSVQGRASVLQLVTRHFLFALVSLTRLFIVGVSAFLHRVCTLFRSQRAAAATVSLALAVFVLWNAEFMFQWGAHLIPPRGPISWRAMIRNQFQVVPRQIAARL